MTRVNVVPVEELTDNHLLAEHREITRIPNAVMKGKYSLIDVPSRYVLGPGHVKFFYTRLKWLHSRYNTVHAECLERGLKVTYKWPVNLPSKLYNNADIVTEHALRINRERIKQRWPKKPRYCKMPLEQ